MRRVIYTAPEQLASRGMINAKMMDVYFFGQLVFFVLTGKEPWN
jgi:hypothetical protein